MKPFWQNFNRAGLLRQSHMIADWDFYFLKVLLASSEERVFFPPGKLNIYIG